MVDTSLQPAVIVKAPNPTLEHLTKVETRPLQLLVVEILCTLPLTLQKKCKIRASTKTVGEYARNPLELLAG
jgi:hypothetical protein